ncbi:MAG: hypothetical protein JNK11_11015 [Alphaproteobacteria bacterium]|nr:hypothetical protein [Alphaproteobacteria bacterium]
MRQRARTGLHCGLASAGLIATALLAVGAAASIPAGDRIGFAVMREDAPLGQHRVSLERSGDTLVATVEIALRLRFAGLTLFRYDHRSVETWQAGRLVALESRTDDDGTSHVVTGRAVPEGFEVTADGKRFMAPADVIPTSYWHPATVAQTSLLDTQNGRLVAVRMTPKGRDQVALRSGKAEACRWEMRGDLAMDLWYDSTGRWVKLTFNARGADVVYVFEGDGEQMRAQSERERQVRLAATGGMPAPDSPAAVCPGS